MVTPLDLVGWFRIEKIYGLVKFALGSERAKQAKMFRNLTVIKQRAESFLSQS